MNYHYIEYMIKERRRAEAEECNRIRLLKSAGYSHEGFVQRLFAVISQKISLINDWVRSLMSFSYLRVYRKYKMGRSI